MTKESVWIGGEVDSRIQRRWCSTRLLCAGLWTLLFARSALGVSERCTSHQDCAVASAIPWCDSATERCDCVFSTYKYGVFCDKICNITGETSQCVNGVCRYNPNDIADIGYCNCSEGWTHDANGLCRKSLCPESCLNRGYCVRGKCSCPPGTTGHRCQSFVNCTELPKPKYGFTKTTRLSGYQTQQFSCRKGFVIKGSSFLICSHGKWSSKPPTCADFDECYHSTHDCTVSCEEVCLNNDGSYICLRMPGRAPCLTTSSLTTGSLATNSLATNSLATGSQATVSPSPGTLTNVSCAAITIVTNGQIEYAPARENSTRLPVGTEARLVCLAGSGREFEGGKAICGGQGRWSAILDGAVCHGQGGKAVKEDGGGRDSRTVAIIAGVVIFCIVLPSVCVAIILWYRERHVVHKYSLPRSQNGSDSSNSASRSTTSSDTGNGYFVPTLSTKTTNANIGTSSSHIYDDAIRTRPIVAGKPQPLSNHYAARNICKLQAEHRTPSPALFIPAPTTTPSSHAGGEIEEAKCSAMKASRPEEVRSQSALDAYLEPVASFKADVSLDYDNEVVHTLPRGRHKRSSSCAGIPTSKSVSDCLDKFIPPLTSQPPPRKFSSTRDMDMRRRASTESEYENPEAVMSADAKADARRRTQAALIRNFRRLSAQQLSWRQDSSLPSPEHTYDSPDSDSFSPCSSQESPDLPLNSSTLLQDVLDGLSSKRSSQQSSQP